MIIATIREQLEEMNLLIIDDDSISSFINTRVAQTSALFKQITSVHNGKDALEFFEGVRRGETPTPHMILLDLNMPLLNGFDFIEALRNLEFPKKENVGIVILTSSEQADDLEQARKLGIEHYLVKPLTVNDLQRTIFSLHKTVWGKPSQDRG